MRHANNSTTTAGTANGGLGHWNTPLPYLFTGLGLVLGLITIALLILACSNRKSSTNSTNYVEEKAGDKKVNVQMAEMEPKINVVIMAGDENPRYLAKPVSCSYCQQTEQV